MFRKVSATISAAALALGFAASTAKSQAIDVIMALPAQTLTFASVYVAEDMGFLKKEGLNVSFRNLVGVASPNAVIAGSADFTYTTAPVFLRAAAKGQPLFAIANLLDKPMVEIVLRKDVAERIGITENMPLAERAKRLKGLTIAIQGVGSIVHAWERYVVAKGGLDVENDVRIAPMDPPAMLPALENKAVDGYTTSMPFTTQAVLKGSAIMLASSVTDAPELIPFAYGLLYTRPEVCQKSREMCARMARAFQGAAKMIQEQPDKVFEEVLKKRFAKMEPELLKAAWDVTQKAHAKDIRVNKAMLDNSQKVSIDAKLLEPADVLKNYDGLYTDEFLK
ncbi:MAG: ABC transporter substrate-binding protein [Bradyrhizobiaceae bacterium]|nr:ABC transporter substrate-binding protein [Bradyrhizobiaceae bacterium]